MTLLISHFLVFPFLARFSRKMIKKIRFLHDFYSKIVVFYYSFTILILQKKNTF